jgi:hypothetical protein
MRIGACERHERPLDLADRIPALDSHTARECQFCCAARNKTDIRGASRSDKPQIGTMINLS